MDRISNRAKILIGLAMIIVILMVGVIGFIMIEGDQFLDALYMTVITISTVGFGELHKLSAPGKIFTMFLILLSITTYAYALSTISNYIFEGQLKLFTSGYGKKAIQKMHNHFIICGFGRNGQQAARELKAHQQHYVIIDQSSDVLKKSTEAERNIIEGDATQDEILQKANIKTARAIITTLPIDADNLYVVLSARTINPNLVIISRASDESSERKLRMAGVNNVVMPERVGGAHMANLVTSPDILEFLDHVSVHGHDPTRLEEIVCPELQRGSESKTINDLKIRRLTGVNIIGFKTPDGVYILNPKPDTRLTPGSKLFVLGTPDEIVLTKKILAQ